MDGYFPDVERQSIREKMADYGATPLLHMKNGDGTVLLAHAEFDRYEGPFESAPYLRLHLCTAHVGRLVRHGADGSQLEGVIRPGTIGVTLPNFEAEGCWPRTQATNIMVHADNLTDIVGDEVAMKDLEASSAILHRDDLLTSVMNAIWRDAEAHGMSSAFFEHGLAVIFRRLAEVGRKTADTDARPVRPLSKQILRRVLELIESRLGSDVKVSELARECGQDVRSFTRAFKSATGFAPYEYLTYRRIEAAKQLLLSGTAVTEIALSMGYSNPSKFAAAFRRLSGCSPTQWRREQG